MFSPPAAGDFLREILFGLATRQMRPDDSNDSGIQMLDESRGKLLHRTRAPGANKPPHQIRRLTSKSIRHTRLRR
jgi:hypothetical protein